MLVCTWERDALPCEESPNFYDLNMEIGRITDPEISKEDDKDKDVETIPTKKETRQPNRKKQSIIMEELLKEAEKIEPLEEIMEEVDASVGTYFETSESRPQVDEVKIEPSDMTPLIEEVKKEPSDMKPLIEEVQIEPSKNYQSVKEVKLETIENSPAVDVKINGGYGDGSNLRKGRMISRGSKKFRLNV